MKVFTKGLILLGISMFALAFIVSGAGTTLRGNTLTYDGGGGTLENIETIELLGNNLIISDKSQSTVVALFNADPLFPQIKAQQMIDNLTFPNTTTSFLGEVNNFDNIDGFSRFRENNLNNGTNAASGFQAVNDKGWSFTIGIGSSNLEFAGEDLANHGAINAITPARFDFVNNLFFGWHWRINTLNSTTNFSLDSVMQLSPEGNLIIDGNFTGNQFYGEMFSLHVLTPEVISVPSLAIINDTGIFNTFKITGWEKGDLNGFDFFNDTLIANVDGLFNVKFGVTYENSAGGRHVFIVVQNGVAMTKVVGAGYVANANDIRSVNGNGFLRVQEGDVLEIHVGDRFNPPTDVEVLSSGFNLIRIGS